MQHNLIELDLGFHIRGEPFHQKPLFKHRGCRVVGCSDSDSDSGLLIDSNSGSDSVSGFDSKYEINNTYVTSPASLRRPNGNKKRNISYWLWLSFLRMVDLYPSYHSCLITRMNDKAIIKLWLMSKDNCRQSCQTNTTLVSWVGGGS